MTDDPFASFKDRLNQPVDQKTPATKEAEPVVALPPATKPVVKKAKPPKKAVQPPEGSPNKAQEKLRVSKLIAPSITDATWIQLGTVLEAAINAGNYKFQTEQAIIRAAIMAYIEGMELSQPVGEGAKQRRSVYVTEPEHAKYTERFKDLGFKKSEIVERAVLTFMKNGLNS